MIDDDCETRKRPDLFKRLSERGPVLRVNETRIYLTIENLESSHGSDRAGLVNKTHADGIGSDDPGIDEVIRANSGRRIESSHDPYVWISQWIYAGRVFQFIQ